MLHIYGSLGIKSYGVCIAIALILFMICTYNALVKTKILSEDHFLSLMICGIISAIMGGRALYLSYHTEYITGLEVLALWQGGFSILGSIIAVSLSTIIYAYWHHLPFTIIADRFALYGPLLQSLSRIGCFLSGCCWGIPSPYYFSIVYTDPMIVAPLHIPLHPTQLYSSIVLLIIFLILYVHKSFILKKPSLMVALYFLLVSLERFSIDFWRGEREFIRYPYLQFFSINQWIALGIIMGSLLYMYLLLKKNYELIFSHQKSGLHS